MIIRRSFTQFQITAVAVFIIVLFLGYHLMGYDNSIIINGFKSAYGTRVYHFRKTSSIKKNQIIFPANMKSDNVEEFVQKYSSVFDMEKLKNPKLIKAKKEDQTTIQAKSRYVKHPITVYDGSKNINLNAAKCNTLLKQDREIEIDKPCSLDKSLVEILEKFLEEYSNEPYYQEMAPFFINELKLQLKYNVVDRYWYRLAGSSVWLKNYGVHLMISRVIYSPKGLRNQPILSLTYAQIFDKNWRELTNTKLLVPSNTLADETTANKNDDSKKGKRTMQVLSFPYFLPIPFYHDYDDTDGKYYGPEDPRIILVKNEKGYEEPLIVFNAHHRKLEGFDDDEDTQTILRQNFYRSMFICWPWQTQKGKANVDGIPSKDYDNKVYNKVVELRIKNLPRQKKQKNWTPFISDALRSQHKHDKYINFVYRWANLEILRCDLAGGTGVCSFTYRLNNKLFPGAQIGPLRGGTSLININEMLKNVNGVDHTSLIPSGREIWAGFARAHLDKCGCGNNMYRPNLVVLVKDSITIKEGSGLFGGEKETSEYTKDVYKISHLSSSISFDVPIIGWNLNNPKAVCYGSNILIPNGISSWSVNSLETDVKSGNIKSEDYLTLSVSISDFTVDRINVKGLLNEILNFDDRSLVLIPMEDDSPDDPNLEGFDYSQLEKLNIPDSKTLSKLKHFGLESLPGFNNDNVVCALQGSVKFCAEYGREQDQFESENDEYFDAFEYGEESSDIERYNHALENQRFRQSSNRWKNPSLPKASTPRPKINSRPKPNRPTRPIGNSHPKSNRPTRPIGNSRPKPNEVKPSPKEQPNGRTKISNSNSSSGKKIDSSNSGSKSDAKNVKSNKKISDDTIMKSDIATNTFDTKKSSPSEASVPPKDSLKGSTKDSKADEGKDIQASEVKEGNKKSKTNEVNEKVSQKSKNNKDLKESKIEEVKSKGADSLSKKKDKQTTNKSKEKGIEKNKVKSSDPK